MPTAPQPACPDENQINWINRVAVNAYVTGGAFTEIYTLCEGVKTLSKLMLAVLTKRRLHCCTVDGPAVD